MTIATGSTSYYTAKLTLYTAHKKQPKEAETLY